MKAVAIDMPALAGRDKRTGRRVWGILSRSRTQQAGYPVYHLLHFDFRQGAWICPCEARGKCVHMELASDASKAEQEAEIIKDEAMRALAMASRPSSRPRKTRQTWDDFELTERVKEAM